MSIKKQIPNTITLLNLASGCVALIFAFEENFLFAFYFVALGIFLDFFDGFFARMFNVAGPLGVQLDSLADMVTSGVVPGLVMYKLLINAAPGFGFDPVIGYLGFIVTLGSCYRLAKFNIDTRQSDSFIGLPTPANALLVLSLPLVLSTTDSLLVVEVLTNPYVLFAISLLCAYLMNAEIPLFSLKVKNFSVQKNAVQLIFLLFSVLFLIFFRFLGVPLLILLYVILSVATNKKTV